MTTISIINRQKTWKVNVRRIRKSLKSLLKELNCEDGEISLLLVDDEQIRKINRTYLNRDRPTNVMSFSMTEGKFGHVNPQTLGDIVVSVETAFRDAAAMNMDFMDEMEFLIIHGLLHLLGYNHEGTRVEEAEKMKSRERELFFLLRHYAID